MAANNKITARKANLSASFLRPPVVNLASTSASEQLMIRRSILATLEIITFLKVGQQRTAALKNFVVAFFPNYKKLLL